MPFSVVIADPNELIRIGLRTILATCEGIVIAAEARTNQELLEQCEFFQPDIVLIDYASPGFTIDIIPILKQKSRGTRFAAITLEQSGQTVINALRAGVTSHIKKDCDLAEIVDCIRQTSCGNQFFCGKILETIQKENIDIEHLVLESFNCEAITLSSREIEIIRMIAEGYTNQQIADLLFLSAHTVNTHRKNIMSKLGVKNTAGIVMYAVKSELVSPNKFLFATDQ
jgi:DNA-binding NarL/FixJ family response regulator